MRKLLALLAACLIWVACVLPAAAVDGQVTYSQGAEKFFFLPGSEYSPTDLFPEFKDVMPGDKLHQKILLKNDISNDCKVKVYMRALGAHADSVEFLTQFRLTVTKGTDTLLFDAPSDMTAQLTDWVYLGTLYSGGECELDVTLEALVTMGNQYADSVGYLDWEFAVEELPVEPDDPKPPQTGDSSRLPMWNALLVICLVLLLLLLLFGRKKKENH